MGNKKNFFDGKEIILAGFLALILIILILWLDVNKESFNLGYSEFGKKCLENCEQIDGVNFNWDLMSYHLNETFGFIECKCVRKIRDSIGFTQGVGIETRILYIDMKTFEIINESDLIFIDGNS